MYLEGSDQHRGWFQSSLLLSLAGNGAAPFKTVLTHGFMVDADREKISKSKQAQGVYEKPQTAEAYVKKYGADIVRLWVASQDFRNDIIVSEERIAKVAETYRGIRNALRYQLSNLYDFDPAKHTVPDDKLTGLDRWILGEFSKLEQEVIKAYDDYEFHVVYQKVSQFIAVELSSIYHDVIKDRLYTDPANSPSPPLDANRAAPAGDRSMPDARANSGLHGRRGLGVCTGENENSVHEGKFIRVGLDLSEEERMKWRDLLALREFLLPHLEKARQDKLIGKALEARLQISGRDTQAELWRQETEGLQELLNVSKFVSEAKSAGVLEIDLSNVDVHSRKPSFPE